MDDSSSPSTLSVLPSYSSTSTVLPSSMPTIPVKLNGRNYFYWKWIMTPLLTTYGLLDYVEGRVRALSKTVMEAYGKAMPNPDYLNWQLRDNLALTCVMLAVMKEIKTNCNLCSWVTRNVASMLQAKDQRRISLLMAPLLLLLLCLASSVSHLLKVHYLDGRSNDSGQNNRDSRSKGGKGNGKGSSNCGSISNGGNPITGSGGQGGSTDIHTGRELMSGWLKMDSTVSIRETGALAVLRLIFPLLVPVSCGINALVTHLFLLFVVH
ncbi:hypothetical protein CRG98_042989 [Punica granatum]|uniref:Retrotransposon Copia-like N-terminal domain-containing protein n=1 Tax=Punica granatum TaxID=22663 RepID=A0A2I0HZD5_PUNGR|nr:hypothetical protein CRG98_042989 [Punica granatum]